LASDYPGADVSAFTRNISSSDISVSGILVDNTLYYHSANSRFGAYPYPHEMRHGVFSVTKSSQAALTMLRLAEKYGEQVFDIFVTDYLNVTATHNGWNGVTFGHLLNMVAGIGDRYPDPNAQVTFADENDEDSSIWVATWNTYPKNSKLDAAFRYGDYPWAPGQIVRYNTAHTYILGAAMHSFYETMEGPGANVWQMMQDEVYRPIGINVIPTMQTVDTDPIPIYGFGLFLNAYDTARITQLLSNDGAYRFRLFDLRHSTDSIGESAGSLSELVLVIHAERAIHLYSAHSVHVGLRWQLRCDPAQWNKCFPLRGRGCP